MKIGRNDPCPCGSGKKYKKCCLQKDEEERNTLEAIPISSRKDILPYVTEEAEDEEIERHFNAESMHSFLSSFHGFILRSKPHIKAYRKVRRLHEEVIDSMINYYQDGKFEQKINHDQYKDKVEHDKAEPTKERTQYFLESDFNMETDLGFRAFMDMMVYRPFVNMNCITEEYLEKHRYRKPEKIELLQSMLASGLSLYQVDSVNVSEGTLQLKDVFTGREITVTDIGLSTTSASEGLYLYQRIISYQGINFNAGFVLLFEKSDPFIQDFIAENKKDYRKEAEFRRFSELYNHQRNTPSTVGMVRHEVR